jgi:DNA recombination protein RmuC
MITYFLLALGMLLCLVVYFIIKQHSHLETLLTLSKSSSAEHHYYHLSQQLFQSMESLNHSLLNSSQQAQSLVHDSFQKVHKETQEQVSKNQLQTQGIFNELIHRFTGLDHWQQQVQELTHKIHQLAKVLDNSALKGKFGEMHLENLIRSLYPASWVQFQETLSNGTRVDCLLSMGDDMPKIPIDSKFPLQTFKMVINNPNQQEYLKEFVQVMKKNISDIAQKYIIPGITTDYAIMFIPSDGLFTRIIELDDVTHFAQQSRVLLCSPQTLFWLLSMMKKFLIDMHLDHQRFKKLAVLEEIANHAVELTEKAQQLEKKASSLSKEMRGLKSSLAQLTDLIESISVLPTLNQEKPHVEESFADQE